MSQSISLYKQLANHKLFNKTINFDLNRIKLVLKKLNHPERKLNNVINILGSSGKFTTLHSLKCFIEYNNQTATAFISPSIKSISERFWMGDRYLTNKEIRYSIKIIEEEKINCPINRKNLVGKWKSFFPNGTLEIYFTCEQSICTYELILYIIKDY